LFGGVTQELAWHNKELVLNFNSEEGRRFGKSYRLHVPVGLISHVQPVTVVVPSTIALHTELVRNYPNPLASILSQHNLQQTKVNALKIIDYVERALPQDEVVLSGVEFNQNMLLYADWDYLAQNMRGGVAVEVNAPFFTVQKELLPSLFELARAKIETGWLATKLSDVVSSKSNTFSAEGRVRVLSEPISTTIEGEECIVVLCGDAAFLIPVLIKKRLVRYPIEFIGFIMSKLRFYGDIMYAPLVLEGTMFYNIMLARVIGYIESK
jgi:hypothetical protein